MEIRHSFTVNKPITAVWDVLGNRFGAACEWASGLYHSEAYNAATLPGAPAANRACDTSFGKIKEEIAVFDTANHHLAYRVTDGFPGFIRSATNNWRLSAAGPDQTRVDIHFIGELTGLMGALMRPMMTWKLRRTLHQAGADFKTYLETGRPSARKAKELARRPAVAA